MKLLYSRVFSVTTVILFLILFSHQSYAQTCPNSGTGGTTAYDTTIATPEGVNTLQIKFPQFNPLSGMVTCVKLCVSITGIVDSVSVENNSTSAQTANVYYNRIDNITGPGLITPLTNTINYHYGPYALSATDGTIGSGTDLVTIAHDTLLNAVTSCRPFNDSTTLAQFYGTDSVTYTYNITAFTSITCTGGNYNSSISTAAFVNFHFEYCTCPPTVLPLSILNFNVTKLTGDKAELKWSSLDDPYSNYSYEVQVSTDGHSFTTVGRQAKNETNTDAYRFIYQANNSYSGVYFFRIKQVYSSGYSRFSNVKQMSLENSDFPKYTLYPNPSSGIVGIKFDNIYTGHFIAQIYNTQGQLMVKKDIVTNGASYVEVASVKSGFYWLRLTDPNSQKSSVNQLLIK